MPENHVDLKRQAKINVDFIMDRAFNDSLKRGSYSPEAHNDAIMEVLYYMEHQLLRASLDRSARQVAEGQTFTSEEMLQRLKENRERGQQST